ncbi:MAG: response regulator transcription factor [Spirochaetales bacterium]|nr:response regulator transcription factor [Spirochaetales bacterium]
MLHYLFLWQMLGMLVSFGSVIVLIYQYKMSRNSYLIMFLLSIVFTFDRTVIFSLSNYSNASSAGFISFRFEQSLPAGFLYILMISLSIYFLIAAVFMLFEHKTPLWLSIIFWLYYAFSMSLYLYMIFGGFPSYTPFPGLFNCTIMTTLPFLAGKIVFLLSVIVLIFSRKVSKEIILETILLGLFILIQAADGMVRFLPGSQILSLPLYFILPGAAYMIILPRILYRRRKTGSGKTLQTEITSFAEKYRLNDEDIELVTSLLEGMSNKEIAFDKKLTLSTVKHRFHAIYRKLGISSRAEVFAKFRK